MPYNERLSVGDLFADSQVTPDPARPGTYVGWVKPAFCGISAQGGLLVTFALRAGQSAVGRGELAALSAQATFCQPVPAGEVQIETRPLRVSNSIAQVCAEVKPRGTDATAVHVAMTFGRRKAGAQLAFEQRRFPTEVPPPDTLRDVEFPPALDATMQAWPIFYQSRVRPAVGHMAWERDWKAGPGLACIWVRLHKPPVTGSGVLDTLCYPFMCDVLGPAVGQALGPGLMMNLAMSTLNMDVQVLGETRSEWLLQVVRCHEARDGLAYGTLELWDSERNLVALASQRALVRATGQVTKDGALHRAE